MIEIRPYNKETECKVNDGVAPNTILYNGLIENAPDSLIAEKVGYKNLWNVLKNYTENEDSILITEI